MPVESVPSGPVAPMRPPSGLDLLDVAPGRAVEPAMASARAVVEQLATRLAVAQQAAREAEGALARGAEESSVDAGRCAPLDAERQLEARRRERDEALATARRTAEALVAEARRRSDADLAAARAELDDVLRPRTGGGPSAVDPGWSRDAGPGPLSTAYVPGPDGTLHPVVVLAPAPRGSAAPVYGHAAPVHGYAAPGAPWPAAPGPYGPGVGSQAHEPTGYVPVVNPAAPPPPAGVAGPWPPGTGAQPAEARSRPGRRLLHLDVILPLVAVAIVLVVLLAWLG